MKLSQLLDYNEIVIQCHDNPDADAIASAFALYQYLSAMGKEPRIVYGGPNVIRKSNLVMMIKSLEIPISYVTDWQEVELLVTVDCQYGEGNVSHLDARRVAVIDHHRATGNLPPLSEVRSQLGSCATLMWNLILEEGKAEILDKRLGTALYYGLFMDTNEFTELFHPLDKDLQDSCPYDQNLITQFKNANISLEELEIAGAALMHSDYLDEFRCALVKAGPCDPNVLGIICDLVLEVDAVDIALVFNVTTAGVKVSIRSCVKHIQANEFAEFLCAGIGSGGGHNAKAGGFMSLELVKNEYLNYCKEHNLTPRMTYSSDGKTERPADSAVRLMIENRMRQYFRTSEIIDAKTAQLDYSTMDLYVRKPIPVGYIKGIYIFPAGTHITLRTLQGDVDTKIDMDTVILIDVRGEISLIKEATLRNNYRIYDWKFTLKDMEYQPTIRDNNTGKIVSLMENAFVCVPTSRSQLRAKRLDHPVRLFTEWDDSKYVRGKIGDYLGVNEMDTRDMTVIDKDVFERCYEPVYGRKEDKIRGIVFDLDGTLLNTLQDLTNGVNHALASQGLPERSLEEVRQFVGNGIELLMVRAVPSGKENPAFTAAFEEFKHYYGAHCNDYTEPYEDIINLLQELKERDIKMAIVSNKIDSAVKELSRLYFGSYMSAAIGERVGVARKPAPDTVFTALQELGIPKQQAIYVGDSDVDIATAKAAGIPCVSVTWGFRNKKFLLDKGADSQLLIDKPLELLNLL